MLTPRILLVACATVLAGISAAPVEAQSEDRYAYCRDRAEDLTGYDGRSPDRHRRGNVIEDAVKGSIRGRVVSGIFGADKEERDRAARRAARGAILGGIIKRTIERDRENRKRREYRRELDRCMDGY